MAAFKFLLPYREGKDLAGVPNIIVFANIAHSDAPGGRLLWQSI